jgi:hypothetical protein
MRSEMDRTERRLHLSLVLVGALFTLAFVRAQASTPGPDSHTQPLLDGCQRSDSLQLAVSTPEWVYVNANDVRIARLTGDDRLGRRTVEGVVSESRPAGEDLYLNHNYHDFNVLIRPDAPYEDVLGSGNHNPGREQDIIEGEWEVNQVPLWAWPSRGDRVRASGNWIWDCGHWGNSAADPTSLSQLLIYDPIETIQDVARPGAIRGETTELHPLYEVATFRANAAGRLQRAGARVLSTLDVWINGNGGPAQANEECALKGITNAVVARVACSSARDVAGTYSYTMKLRPRPSAGSRLIVNPVFNRSETMPQLIGLPVRVVPDPAHGIVKVSFDLPHTTLPQKFGISVSAGWSDDQRAVAHTVTLKSIHIARSLDGASEPNLNPAGAPGEQTTEEGEWVLYANISGRWVQLPGISQVTDGATVPLGIKRTFYLPQGVTPRLYVSGHECDEPLIDCEHESPSASSSALIGSLELGFNDRPGRIQDDRLGVLLRLGTAAYHPPANPDPGSGNEDLSDAVCGPNGCYTLTVVWRRGRA